MLDQAYDFVFFFFYIKISMFCISMQMQAAEIIALTFNVFATGCRYMSIVH